jgi:two-component system OmpR family response regulator
MSRLLVAEDDPNIRLLLQRVSERCGFVTDAAADGVEAMRLLQTNRYTVALLDLMMPNLSGYEVIKRLRGSPDRPKFIVVTAMTDEYVAKIAPDQVDAIVRKPFDIDMLCAVISEVAGAVGEKDSEPKLQGERNDQGIELQPDDLTPGLG